MKVKVNLVCMQWIWMNDFDDEFGQPSGSLGNNQNLSDRDAT